ncbi:MAG: hypothetical protein CEE43_19010 [Promethearchaeota archaeon Loki_b32]|nr:MAG: hypothetical protein CEE43_19010 [Candidatus Lokiarchaeota archaeon Loki_b32]
MVYKIEEVVSTTPANIGVFCASYKILDGLLNDVRMTYKFASMVNKYGKELFIENSQKSASDNADMLDEFKACSNKQGAVLLGVCGGRNSEGEDYPGGFMNSVIIVGIPYHLPTPRVEAKIKYYDTQFNRQGLNFAYLYPAMQRANQASGRPIRRKTDKGLIIFMDERFNRRMKWISEWVNSEVRVIPDRKGIISTLSGRFWNR